MEEPLTKIKRNDPLSLALTLSKPLGSPDDIEAHKACAYFLRKLLIKDDLCTWRNLSLSTQSTVKCAVLQSMILHEESSFIIIELRNIVCKLATALLPDNNWPELLPFLDQCLLTSRSDKLKNAAFFMYAQLGKDIGETIVPSGKKLQRLFFNTLNDNTLDIYLRMAAMRAVISLVQCVPDSNGKERFQDLLPGLMRTFTDGLSNDDTAQYGLQRLTDLAKNEPQFLRTQVVDVVATLFGIAETEGLNEGTRHLAIEFLITLAEARKTAPGMMKRLPSFTSRCFAVLLKLLADIKDDPKAMLEGAI